jgi:serine/threonine protein kinase
MIAILGTADAMAYLHGQRICHSDLKPANILLDSSFRPKLCDFGFSKRVEKIGDSQKPSDCHGKTGFTAPEAALEREDRQVFREDVYSFAMTVYNIVVGKRPFEGFSDYRILNKLQNNERPSLDGCEIPQDLRRLIEDSWEDNPTLRPQFPQIVDMLNRPDELQILLPGTDRERYREYQLDLQAKSFCVKFQLEEGKVHEWECRKGATLRGIRNELAEKTHLGPQAFTFWVREAPLDLDNRDYYAWAFRSDIYPGTATTHPIKVTINKDTRDYKFQLNRTVVRLAVPTTMRVRHLVRFLGSHLNLDRRGIQLGQGLNELESEDWITNLDPSQPIDIMIDDI